MPAVRSASLDLLRLTTRVVNMYYEQGIGQSRIAEQLGISQTRVSRLIKQAEELGIVRITVHVPSGVYADIERELETRYGLDEMIVVEVDPVETLSDEEINTALSSATAAYLELVLPSFTHIGVSSWSSALLAGVNAMRPTSPGVTQSIVQVLGGLGMASSQVFATRLTERLAQLTKAEAVFMLAPGVVGSLKAKEALLTDPACREALERFDDLSAVLMGIGSLPPSRMLRESGNVFTDADIDELHHAGAVGDVCMRFFDEQGQAVQTSFNEHVLGISTAQLMNARRRIGVAGGKRKFEAIRAALRGQWLTTLITDLQTAQQLLENP